MVTKSKAAMHDGREVFIFTIKNAAGNTVAVTNYGATVMKILVPDRDGRLADVCLGFDTVEEYIKDSPFFGSTVGRYANRIAKGRFTLNGKEYVLDCNENPFSHLHGGKAGFDKKVWDAEVSGGELLMTYVSADGEEGYPGELTVKVKFAWSDDNELSIEYNAVSDKDTIINLTNHSYFNLNGAEEDITGHELTLNSSYYTPVDEHLIPTGETAPVAGTPFDFTTPHKFGERIDSDHPQMLLGGGYDHNFIIEGEGLRFFVRVYDRQSGRALEVFSDQPAVQVYTSNMMGDIKGKKDYHRRWGFCVETQNYPDAINHPYFPSCVLKAKEKYTTTTKFRFSAER